MELVFLQLRCVLATDEDAGEQSNEARRFDGPSRRFAKSNRRGDGWQAADWKPLDSAISAALDEQPTDLARAEEDLEEWLRRRANLGSEPNGESNDEVGS